MGIFVDSEWGRAISPPPVPDGRNAGAIDDEIVAAHEIGKDRGAA